MAASDDETYGPTDEDRDSKKRPLEESSTDSEEDSYRYISFSEILAGKPLKKQKLNGEEKDEMIRLLQAKIHDYEQIILMLNREKQVVTTAVHRQNVCLKLENRNLKELLKKTTIK